VQHQVQREVEGCDPQDRSVRESSDHRHAPGRGRIGIQPLQFPGPPSRFFGRPPERGDAPIRLGPRPHQRLAVLCGDQVGDFVGPSRQLLRDVHQSVGPLGCGGGDRLGLDVVRRSDGRFDVGCGRHTDAADHSAVERVVDVDDLIAGAGLPRDPERQSSHWVASARIASHRMSIPSVRRSSPITRGGRSRMTLP